MTMVERVARALCTQHYEKRFAPIKGNPHAPHIMMNVEGNWHVFLESARAAIEAMKEPENRMFKAMFEAMIDGPYDGTQAPWLGAGWQAAVEAALEEEQ